MRVLKGFFLFWGGIFFAGMAAAQAQSIGVQKLRGDEIWLNFRPRPTSAPNAAVSRQFFLETSQDMATWDTVNDIDLTNAYAYQNGIRVPSELLEDTERYFRFRANK